MAGFEQKTKERFLAVAILVVVFLAGLLVGLAVPPLFHRGGMHRTFVVAGPRAGFNTTWRGRSMAGARFRAGGWQVTGRVAGPGPVMFAPILAKRLGLSAKQVAQIDTIVERRRVRTDSVLRAIRPQFKAELDSTRAEIRAVLTPDQRKRFDSYMQAGRTRLLLRFAPPTLRRRGPVGPGGMGGGPAGPRH